ncbi:hypothetical protein D9M71_752000 [compost metagenome]
MHAPLTLPHAKRLSVSRSIPLLSAGLFATSPLSSAFADASKIEDSTLTPGTVNVQGTTRGFERQQRAQLRGYSWVRHPRKNAGQTTAGSYSALHPA